MISRREWLALGIAAHADGFPAAPWTGFPTIVAPPPRRAFQSPGREPNGLQATADGLWIVDQKTNRASLVRYEDGSPIREFDTATDRPSGITFDGSALWIASTYSRTLVKADARTGKTLMQFSSPGSGVVQWVPRGPGSEVTGAHGLEFSRGWLWVSVPPSATVYAVDPESGTVLRSFPAPGVRPHGLGWDPDGSLWCAETNYRSFFKLSSRSGKILKQIMLPPLAPEKDGMVLAPHGMTIRKGVLWFSVAETGEIYRLPLSRTTRFHSTEGF